MENTINNKIKFSSQYHFQKVAFFESGVSGCVGDYWGPIDYLELIPLSKISNDDASEVGRLFLIATETIEERDFSKEDILILLDECGFLPYQCVDYLRSKGYALPYMGLTIEKLIEYGWVKLKSELI